MLIIYYLIYDLEKYELNHIAISTSKFIILNNHGYWNP